MSRENSLPKKIGGLAVATLLRRLMKSIDVKIAHYDRTVDPALPEFRGGAIYVFWHEYITFPIALWRRYDLALLISRHRDADWLIRATYHLGFQTVRGSTNRGGAAALRELQRRASEFDLVITPDGPQGPRRELALGPVYLASRLGLPIVPVGFGFDRPRRMKTWDRFAVPRPGSRGRCIFGPRVEIPRRLRRGDLESYRCYLERILNRLSDVAEQWAASGQRIAGETPFVRQRRAFERIVDRSESPRILTATGRLIARPKRDGRQDAA